MLAPAPGASASAAGALTFVPCPRSSGFSCASLPVPLSRSGQIPGTISLKAQRRLAGSRPSHSAVLALAGGPGQAALGLSEFVAQAMAPALRSRDLLVFDQRGTGGSDPLGCSALEASVSGSVPTLFEKCALQIGQVRGGFTTAESVEDIEALREAGGYEKLVLYGTSYGTKVALQYAERHPQNVEALVLDSVVVPDGPEPFYTPTFRAIPGVLRELCAGGECAAITSNPVAALALMTSRLRTHALSGSVYDGSGRRHASTLNQLGLLQTLEAGDLNPALRALLPAAVQSALHNDPDPLLRLHLLSEGLIPSLPREPLPPESDLQVDEALFATTTCEETLFPWQRSAPASIRRAEALSFLRAQPTGAFYPFEASVAWENSLAYDCWEWPDASPPPPAEGALPDVPTLIFSGAQDLRTPTSNARAVAARIPDAQLELVPYTGHSVIGSDLGACAGDALRAFFAGRRVRPCTPSTNLFAPTPLTPTKLAYVHPPGTLGGAPGKTLVAVLDTLLDLSRQIISATLQADQELPSGASFGGLRGGYARLTSSKALLHEFSFVPGVTLSGTLPVSGGKLKPATIRVGGAFAAAGEVTLGAGSKRVSGTLDGRRFDIPLATVKLASARAASGWPAAAALARLLRGGARRGSVAYALSQLPR